MPEDTEFPLIRFLRSQGFNRAVHAEVLMVLGGQLHQPTLGFHKQREVPDDV